MSNIHLKGIFQLSDHQVLHAFIVRIPLMSHRVTTEKNGCGNHRYWSAQLMAIISVIPSPLAGVKHMNGGSIRCSLKC